MPRLKDFDYEDYDDYEEEYKEKNTKMHSEDDNNGKKPQWRADRRKAKLMKEKMQKE